jgi:predicted nucleic acid-binding protein
LRAFQDNAISIITWMEVMVGATEAQAGPTALFLASLQVIPVDDEVARCTVAVRQLHHMKLLDGIIGASAQTTNRLLVTRNSKDFPQGDPGLRLPTFFKRNAARRARIDQVRCGLRPRR